jgi:pimeloyl-ACP methyl ester carboxylesterase
LLPLLALAAGLCSGCTLIPRLGSDPRGGQYGLTFYVGGAWPLGHLGTIDVPKGLRAAGYRGAIEVFGWQSTLGGTLRDQLDRERNQEQARRLAERIRAYRRRHSQGRVNIVALSAGSGIATWALEALPEDLHVGTVIFLSSSLSRYYDLRPALRRIDGKLYNFYSPDDPVLRYAVPLAGSVDRETRGLDVAGLYGFQPPAHADPATTTAYQRVRNKPYRRQYGNYGYRGLHADATSVDFVRHVLAPLLLRADGPATPAAPPQAAADPTPAR